MFEWNCLNEKRGGGREYVMLFVFPVLARKSLKSPWIATFCGLLICLAVPMFSKAFHVIDAGTLNFPVPSSGRFSLGMLASGTLH